MNFIVPAVRSTLGADLSEPEYAPLDDTKTEMSPVSFGDCFGWHHTSSTLRGGDVAVLLCPALNRDALDSHHSLRMLADRFAAAGYPVLRFDYPGTGDSSEVIGEPWAAWQQSVHVAADWLRQATGARRVLFCGLRIGAALAALTAATRADAAGLILLAPVLRGHSYMRQLSIEAQLQNGAPSADGSLDFHELHLSAQTVSLIGKADLRALQFPAEFPIAIFAQSPSTALTTCIAKWTRCGASVAIPGFDGLAPLLRHNLIESCDLADFAQLMDWVHTAIPARPTPRLGLSGSAILRPPGCTETPLRFGPDDRLFGMLCEPEHGRAKLAVITTNAGRDPHYGFARFGVEFARRLAARGIASLRLDFAGIGDSIGPPGEESVLSHVFETDRAQDISAAVDVLEERGYEHFAIQGLCAGAYHSLHGAMADPRISTLLLINLPMFAWKPGDTIDFFNQKHLTADHFLSQLGSRSWWRRLLRGQVPLGTLLRAQIIRQWQRIGATRLARLGRPTLAQRMMGALSARKARTLFLFAPADSAVETFQQEFGENGARLRHFHGTAMAIVPGLDHQMSTPAMRHDAIELMLEFLPPLHKTASAALTRVPYPVAP